MAMRSTMKATARVTMPKNAPARPLAENNNAPSSAAARAASPTPAPSPSQKLSTSGSRATPGTLPSVTTLIA